MKALTCFVLLPLLVSLSTLVLAEENAGIVQKLCPVMEGNEIDPDIYVDYEGKRVYFCCNFCKTEFLKNPEKYTGKLPQFGGTESAVPAEDSETARADEGGRAGFGEYVGRFHPVMVHFPVALIIVAFLGEALFMITGVGWFSDAARFCILLGAVGALAAITTGFLAEESAGYTGEYEEVLDRHELLGLITAGAAVAAAVLSEVARAKKKQGLLIAYRAALLVSFVLVGATGMYGGMLVYGIGHYSW